MPTKSKPRRATRQADESDLHIRLESDDVACVSMSDVEPAMMDETIPWRTSRWYFGQCHHSGAYWSATESGPVIYESRPELSRLLRPDGYLGIAARGVVDTDELVRHVKATFR
jgi:hypothetical protein